MKQSNLLADLLADVMERNKWSQRDLARELDVSLKAVQNWLHQEGTPRLRTSSLIKLSSKLNIDIKTIAALVSPDNVYDVSPAALLRAQQIEKLPTDIRDSIDVLIMLGLKKLEDSIDNS